MNSRGRSRFKLLSEVLEDGMLGAIDVARVLTSAGLCVRMTDIGNDVRNLELSEDVYLSEPPAVREAFERGWD